MPCARTRWANSQAAVLDALRQPLEEGVVRVSRARGTVTLPARFVLVGAMNPCPCGDGGPPGSCRCTPAARARYARRLSGPLLDRFDLVVPLHRPEPVELLSSASGESSAAVAERVARARQVARDRGVACNAVLPSAELDRLAPLTRGGGCPARSARPHWDVERTRSAPGAPGGSDHRRPLRGVVAVGRRRARGRGAGSPSRVGGGIAQDGGDRSGIRVVASADRVGHLDDAGGPLANVAQFQVGMGVDLGGQPTAVAGQDRQK